LGSGNLRLEVGFLTEQTTGQLRLFLEEQLTSCLQRLRDDGAAAAVVIVVGQLADPLPDEQLHVRSPQLKKHVNWSKGWDSNPLRLRKPAKLLVPTSGLSARCLASFSNWI